MNASSPDTSAPAGRTGSRPQPATGPRLGAWGWLRFIWRQLTSMRTALLLLLLVAVAAIPGSVFPQRPIDLTAVENYQRDHPRLASVLDALQMFDVYTSAWFSAIYLLLVVSLAGCIVPRTVQFWRALSAPPPAVPRRPERLGDSLRMEVDGTPEEVAAHLRTLLRRRRYRLRAAEARTDGVAEVAGESGHLREAGNILFHYGVVAVIVTLAAGYLVGWKADRIVPIGESFANTRSAYHSFSGGPLVDAEKMQPFVVRFDAMRVRFEDQVGTGQLGAPRDFQVDATVRDTPGGTPRTETLAVNEPLHFRGAEVYLLGNGYSPVLTVRDAAGKVVYSQATPFLPQDGNYRSTGAVKVPAASPKQLGFSGVFLPTAVDLGADGRAGKAGDPAPEYESGFPDLNDPLLVLSVYEGTLFPDATPQSVYRLDTRGMKAVPATNGKPLRLALRPGETATLPGGRGTVELAKIDRWAGISTRYDPVKGASLWASLAMLLGLLGSLLVKRRRVFARVHPVDGAATPRSSVLLAGLAQREDTDLGSVLRDLADDLGDRMPGATIIDSTDSRTERP